MTAVDIRKLETLVVTINVTKEFRFRVWLALKVLKIGTWILGSQVKIEHEKESG